MPPVLRCRYCDKMKSVTCFAPSHRGKKTGTCRECNTALCKESRHRTSQSNKIQLMSRRMVCTVCNVEKSADCFRWNPRIGFKTECKECEKVVLRCTECKELRSHSQFPVAPRMVTGRHSVCGLCHKNRVLHRYATNPEYRARQKEHAQSEKAIEWRRQYWLKIKDAVREYHNEYVNWKYHNDPVERNKIHARHAVYVGVRYGFIKRPKECQSNGKYGVTCDDSKLTAHHYKGYDEENWLEIEWLCIPCHKAADMQQKEITL